jgi:hypothetical protein
MPCGATAAQRAVCLTDLRAGHRAAAVCQGHLRSRRCLLGCQAPSHPGRPDPRVGAAAAVMRSRGRVAPSAVASAWADASSGRPAACWPGCEHALTRPPAGVRPPLRVRGVSDDGLPAVGGRGSGVGAVTRDNPASARARKVSGVSRRRPTRSHGGTRSRWSRIRHLTSWARWSWSSRLAPAARSAATASARSDLAVAKGQLPGRGAGRQDVPRRTARTFQLSPAR